METNFGAHVATCCTIINSQDIYQYENDENGIHCL